jgi:hypothetical protein
MKKEQPVRPGNQNERPRDNRNPERPDDHDRRAGFEDFESKVDLPGKTDSGPEPDVFDREIPPQD